MLVNNEMLKEYEMQVRPRKVALVGFASSTIRQDWPEDVEIWTINCAWRYGFTRIDRLFEMHQVQQLTSYQGRQTEWENDHWDWLQKITDYPVYMIEHDERIPNSIPYPFDEVCADVFSSLYREQGGELVRETYLTSSASYLVAMAIHEGVDEINLAGFEMATGSEFTYQRDGMTYLIGVAVGRGIKVILHEKSKLMRSKVYGYEGSQTVDRPTIAEHVQNYAAQREQFKTEFERGVKENDGALIGPNFKGMFRANGAIQSLEHLQSLSDGLFFGRQTLEAHLANYKDQLGDQMGFFNKYNGLLEIAERNLRAKDSARNRKKAADEKMRTEKTFRTMLLCEGAVQATENLIKVCDLQEPNLLIRDVTRFVEEKQ